MNTVVLLRVPCAALLAALSFAPAAAQDAPAKADAKPEPMSIGSDAPVPQIESFVRGTEPAWFEPGKTYVIEFWATWCGPCRQSMPHISDVAEQYKDRVVVVGVSDEKVETVTKFLDTDEWRQKARYNLATDPDRSTHRQYMEAAAQGGIPTAFIVREGKVQWIGHPMSMDEPLKKVVDGTWDAASFKAEFDKETALARKQMERRRAVAAARKAGEWDAILKMMDEDIEAAPERARAQMMVGKFQLLLTDANRPADGYRLGREILAAGAGNAAVLNAVAWFVLDSAKVKDRDPAFALEAARLAVQASGGKDAAILDTMARACWETGDKAKAVEWQKKALEKADGQMAEEMKETLRKYEGGEAPTPTKKASWQGDAPKADPAPGAPAAPGASDAPRAPRMPRPAAKLSPAAEKVFPEVAAEGFGSPEEIIAFLPDAGKDAKGMLRVVRAMRSTSDGGKLSLRVASALIEDMQPAVTASVEKFGKSGSMPIPVPANGARFDLKLEGDSAATIVPLDAEGKPTGQPTALVKADGAWWFDFDKAAAMRPDEGAQMAMMANIMGEAMRMAIRNAAASTAADIKADKFKSIDDANAAFAQAMQVEMMKTMGGPGGPGGPATRPAPPANPPANAPAGK